MPFATLGGRAPPGTNTDECDDADDGNDRERHEDRHGQNQDKMLCSFVVHAEARLVRTAPTRKDNSRGLNGFAT